MPSSETLVKQKYPTAYLHDNGEWVYVYKMTEKEIVCFVCGHKHTHYESLMVWENILGDGPSPGAAWENAAKNTEGK
jgi:hypothetical protein